ncbi:MAG: hypothetical protein ABSD71_09990 [Bacteroidales bacterium]|jgi:hypothetical protein
MPIRKTSADYIDELHRGVEEHYGITIKCDRIKTEVNPFRLSYPLIFLI